jgi:Ca2+-binding RTX toxin-like protein
MALFNGTNAGETIHGSEFADTINGLGGNDILWGHGGADILNGGTGADDMHGGSGNDTYIVDHVDDDVFESSGGGTDIVRASVDYELGSNVEDLLLTGSANIDGTGNAASNRIWGNSGSNHIDGGAGADDMYGGAGNDRYYVDSSADEIFENDGQGTDWVYTTASYTLPDFVENGIVMGPISWLAGNGLENQLQGSSFDDDLYGMGGADVLKGYGGEDRLDGGSGADTMYGGTEDDTYYVDTSADEVVEGSDQGYDYIFATATITLPDNVEYLELEEGAGAISGHGNGLDNYILGNSAVNTLTGGDGADWLNGRGGADVMTGGIGDDRYWVDSNQDDVNEAADAGIDEVDAYVTHALAAHVENLVLEAAGGAIDGTGNDLDNRIYGNSSANVLSGLDGDDRLQGGGGPDTLKGGDGDDEYWFVDGDDLVVELPSDPGTDTVYAAADHQLGANVENLQLVLSAVSGTGNGLDNFIFGNELNNTLTGGGGDDELDGSSGNDTMIGGTGNDTYFVMEVDDIVTEDAGAGAGTDTVEVWYVDLYTLAANVENVVLAFQADNVLGNDLPNVITGNGLANAIGGLDGDDTISAGDNDDGINAGLGADTITGGAGADVFIYAGSADTSIVAFDTITDFNTADGDKINVSFWDADELTAGVQDWTFIGTANYSGAGQIRVVDDGTDTYLAFSTDNDPDNDAAIKVLGLPVVDASWFMF